MSRTNKPIFDYDQTSTLMDEYGVDIILANTRPNVGYLADYYYYEGLPNFMMEDGLSFYEAFAGVPRDQAKEAFIVGCTGEDGYLSWVDPWISGLKVMGTTICRDGGQATDRPNDQSNRSSCASYSGKGTGRGSDWFRDAWNQADLL